MKDIVNKNIEEWSKYPFCEQTQKEINILAKDKSKLHDALDRKSTRLNSSHSQQSRMPSSA